MKWPIPLVLFSCFIGLCLETLHLTNFVGTKWLRAFFISHQGQKQLFYMINGTDILDKEPESRNCIEHPHVKWFGNETASLLRSIIQTLVPWTRFKLVPSSGFDSQYPFSPRIKCTELWPTVDGGWRHFIVRDRQDWEQRQWRHTFCNIWLAGTLFGAVFKFSKQTDLTSCHSIQCFHILLWSPTFAFF